MSSNTRCGIGLFPIAESPLRKLTIFTNEYRISNSLLLVLSWRLKVDVDAGLLTCSSFADNYHRTKKTSEI